MITTFMSRVKSGNFNAELAPKVPKIFSELPRRDDSHCGKGSSRAQRKLYDLKVKGKRTLKPRSDKTRHPGDNSSKSGKKVINIIFKAEEPMLDSHEGMVEVVAGSGIGWDSAYARKRYA
ncbi:hypothetical protein ACH5RR_028953 [Cinchona calisaya]|uniref:Uncharacterized protein n=1 Tax=Cinchona calisaya TaxID=153742 RepID=A0ABD2YUQ7_9GENT